MGALWRRWDAGGERREDTGDYGAVGRVWGTEGCGEERLFRGDEAGLQQGDREEGEDSPGRGHEQSKRESMEPGSEVKGVAEEAVGAGGYDGGSLHGTVLHDGSSEIGAGPGSESGGGEGGQDAEGEQENRGGAERKPAGAGGGGGEGEPSGLGGSEGAVGGKEIVPGGEEAEGEDDSVEEIAETELEGGCAHDCSKRMGKPCLA